MATEHYILYRLYGTNPKTALPTTLLFIGMAPVSKLDLYLARLKRDETWSSEIVSCSTKNPEGTREKIYKLGLEAIASERPLRGSDLHDGNRRERVRSQRATDKADLLKKRLQAGQPTGALRSKYSAVQHGVELHIMVKLTKLMEPVTFGVLDLKTCTFRKVRH